MIGKFSEWYRGNVSDEADCLSCRVVSGIGLLGIGAYLFAQSRRRGAIENYAIKGFAAVAGVLGAARLADASFLKAKPKTVESIGHKRR